MKTKLTRRIEAACASTKPNTKSRSKALSAIKWAIKVSGISNDVYVAATSVPQQKTFTSDPSKAQWFDGRDNEHLKLIFFEALTGEKLEIVLKP